jgi:hypothetical protein
VVVVMLDFDLAVNLDSHGATIIPQSNMRKTSLRCCTVAKAHEGSATATTGRLFFFALRAYASPVH